MACSRAHEAGLFVNIKTHVEHGDVVTLIMGNGQSSLKVRLELRDDIEVVGDLANRWLDYLAEDDE